MQVCSKKYLTYVLVNGCEKTVSFGSEKLLDFIRWFQDEDSNNFYELDEEINEQTTLFKNQILSIRY